MVLSMRIVSCNQYRPNKAPLQEIQVRKFVINYIDILIIGINRKQGSHDTKLETDPLTAGGVPHDALATQKTQAAIGVGCP